MSDDLNISLGGSPSYWVSEVNRLAQQARAQSRRVAFGKLANGLVGRGVATVFVLGGLAAGMFLDAVWLGALVGLGATISALVGLAAATASGHFWETEAGLHLSRELIELDRRCFEAGLPRLEATGLPDRELVERTRAWAANL